MTKLNIKKGQRFGELVVIKELPTHRLPSGQTNRIFLMRCDCGIEKPIRLLHFVRGRIKTCDHRLHGDTGKPLYNIWRSMNDRTKYDFSGSEYYRNKGIKVCKEWQEYKQFREWALKNNYKEGLQIDRINNSKGYTPDNCRFTDKIGQANNKSTTHFVLYKGEEKPLMPLLRENNVEKHYGAIRGRLKRGWSIERAIEYPFNPNGGRLPDNLVRT